MNLAVRRIKVRNGANCETIIDGTTAGWEKDLAAERPRMACHTGDQRRDSLFSRAAVVVAVRSLESGGSKADARFRAPQNGRRSLEFRGSARQGPGG